jgi:hypothetical protein
LIIFAYHTCVHSKRVAGWIWYKYCVHMCKCKNWWLLTSKLIYKRHAQSHKLLKLLCLLYLPPLMTKQPQAYGHYIICLHIIGFYINWAIHCIYFCCSCWCGLGWINSVQLLWESYIFVDMEDLCFLLISNVPLHIYIISFLFASWWVFV